jgi:hypothetical protein
MKDGVANEHLATFNWERPQAWEAAMIAWRALRLTLIVFVLLCIVMTLMQLPGAWGQSGCQLWGPTNCRY